MRIRSNLTQLKASLDKALRRSDLEGPMKEALCLELWDEVVGETTARATRADSIKEGTLFVSVKSSVWAQQLGFLKPEIIRKLNERVGKKIIRDIQFKTRTLKKPVPKPEIPVVSETEQITLSDEEIKSLEQTLGDVRDDHLRQGMLKVLITHRKLEKAKIASGWKPCRRCHSLHPGPEEICPLCRMGK